MRADDIQTGAIGEHLVMADLLLRGINVHQASAGSPFDIIAETKKGLLRIQVKATRKITMERAPRSKPCYLFHVKRCGKHGKKKYKKGAFDCYAFVALDKKEVAYVTFEGASKAVIAIRDSAFDYKGHNGGLRPGIYWQDLTWDNFIEKYAV